MAENKTKQTEASVEAYLDAIADETRRQDCRELVGLMSRISGQPPKMWGSSIVGFGSYHYRYESGREGDSCLTGFSSRKRDISIYLTAYFDGHAEFLEQLGKHKMGKSCLSVRKLSDVRLDVLEQLVAGSIAETKRRYP
ncbi:MAG: DUF1801 domain-containing protein [Gammaproteobacteria bacterium]